MISVRKTSDSILLMFKRYHFVNKRRRADVPNYPTASATSKWANVETWIQLKTPYFVREEFSNIICTPLRMILGVGLVFWEL